MWFCHILASFISTDINEKYNSPLSNAEWIDLYENTEKLMDYLPDTCAMIIKTGHIIRWPIDVIVNNWILFCSKLFNNDNRLDD